MKTLTLSAHYPNIVLYSIRRHEQLYENLLRDVGIAPEVLQEPQARVPVDSHVQLFRQISMRTDDESFGFLPHPIRYGTFAMACEYSSSAATIGEALEKVCRFYGIVTLDVKLRLFVEGSVARFVVELRRPELDFAHFMVETFMCIGYRFSSWLAGHAIPLDSAGFAYSQPDNYNEYLFMFPTAHRFNPMGNNYLEFDADYLNLPVLKTEADVHRYNERAPADLLNKLIGSDSFTNRVYIALSRRGEDDPQDSKTIASELAMTEQTLRRKLRAEGATFQKIKDNLRLDTAIFHLMNNKYTIAEISEKLGYSTPSVFSRAFKSWTGVSPETYRNR